MDGQRLLYDQAFNVFTPEDAFMDMRRDEWTLPRTIPSNPSECALRVQTDVMH